MTAAPIEVLIVDDEPPIRMPLRGYLAPASLAAADIDWDCYFHKPADMEKIARCIVKMAEKP
jgi:hypothetical protein